MEKAKINPLHREKIETLEKNQLKIIQDENNYRFSLDSILLSKFINIKNRERVIDLGTGCGIIPLMIYDPKKNNIIYAVEIQKKMVDIANKNVMLNNLENNIHVIHDDVQNLKNLFRNQFFDVVTANPPYIPIGKGKLNAIKEQKLARHEINLNFESMVSICSYLLKKRGRLYFIHRADNLISIITTLKKYILEPKILKFVYTGSNEKQNAKRVLIEAIKDGGTELKVEKPIFL